ncbi:uncharacterized protein EV422DRAFT_323182 [Fimicolochytrium jonesii]|uniref:uncharacterized protein n=1 Tax=Fimicolochytrium jonesii TaxID=1396493 RepID=UPI0022FF2CF8|nr:uncharacterized protein EV422DRAFT_323182 [Fimicolochytrium jonesii]KAI8824508.1 hypothetical protein EV422DRAFT_323182 [Fimicolochytrium jonesii]
MQFSCGQGNFQFGLKLTITVPALTSLGAYRRSEQHVPSQSQWPSSSMRGQSSGPLHISRQILVLSLPFQAVCFFFSLFFRCFLQPFFAFQTLEFHFSPPLASATRIFRPRISSSYALPAPQFLSELSESLFGLGYAFSVAFSRDPPRSTP